MIRDPESALPSVVKRSARPANVWIGEARPRWVSHTSSRFGSATVMTQLSAVRYSAGRFPCLSLVLRSAVEGGSALVGALCIATRSAHAYSDADEQFLTVVADRVAWVIDGMRARGYLNGEPARLNGSDGTGRPGRHGARHGPTREGSPFSQIPLLKTSSAKGSLDGASRSGGL